MMREWPVKGIRHSSLPLFLAFALTGRDALAQGAYQAAGPSSISVLFVIALCAGALFLAYKKGLFRQFSRKASGESAIPPEATDVEDEGSIDFTISFSRKVKRARNMFGGVLLFSLSLTGLLIWKISQTSELALRFDDGVKEQLGYWGIALILSWLLTAFLGFASAYGASALTRRRAAQTKAVVDRLATLEIDIARATDSNLTGELRSRKVRLESVLRRLEAA